MSLPYQDLFNFIGNRYQPAPQTAVRNVPPFQVVPPSVRPAQEVRPAAPASPAAAAVPAATANPFIDRPNPLTTDQSLYTPILTPVQEPFDFSKYKMPEAPRFQMPEAMPQRDIAMERRQIARGSLRSALLGALLGGGAGALGAMTGAQQGMQQAYDQQYGQEMADYQNRMRMLDLQNQQAQADYNRQLQERGLQVGEALQAYQQQGVAQTVAAQNQDALRRGRLAFAEAVAAGDKAKAERIQNIMSSVAKIDPADQARFIQFGLTGDPSLAVGGFKQYVEPKQVPPPTYAQAALSVDRFLKTWPTRFNKPADYAKNAEALKATLRMSSDPMVAGLADTIPDAMPRDFVSKLRAEIAANKLAVTTADNDEDRKLARQRIAIQQRHLDLAVKAGNLAERREQRLRAGKASVSSYAKDAKAIVNGFVKAINEVQGQVAVGEITPEKGKELIAGLDARMMEAYNRDMDLFASSPKGKSGYIPVLLKGDSATLPKPAAPSGGASGLNAFKPRKVK